MKIVLNTYLKRQWSRWIISPVWKTHNYLFYSRNFYYRIILSDFSSGWMIQLESLGRDPISDPKSGTQQYRKTIHLAIEYNYTLGEVKHEVLKYIQEKYKPSSPWKRS